MVPARLRCWGHPLVLSLLRPCPPQRPPKGTSQVPTSVLFDDIDDSPTSEKIQPIRPTEILCQVLQFVVRAGGVKALLPPTHVSVQWRRAALGDSSLWTTIHLNQTPPPLLDVILARTGNQLLTVHANYGDPEHHARLWVLVDRIEELYYSAGHAHLARLITSLGPAPNLKVLHLRPESNFPMIEEVLPYITFPPGFSDRFPALRDLALTKLATWLSGPFKSLTAFECDIFERLPFAPNYILDAIMESPSIEFLRLVGRCLPPQEQDQPTIALPLLRNCTLVGDGTASLIRFIAVPTTAVMFLGRQYTNDWTAFPGFNIHSVAPGLRVLGELSAISLSISDHTARLQARNDRGVLDVEVDGLHTLSGDPFAFIRFIQDSFECWRTCPGLKTTKDLTLRIERDGIWKPHHVMNSVPTLVRLVAHLPDIERVKLHGLPPSELSSILSILTLSPLGLAIKPRCPNLKRLDVESSPLRTPRSLLVELGELLASRKETGIPLQSVAVKVRCEVLIAATDHCALLTFWEGLVEESVRLEYERIEVKKLLWRRYRLHPEEDEDEDGDGKGDGEANTGDPGDCVGWDGWPEKWPSTVEEMKR